MLGNPYVILAAVIGFVIALVGADRFGYNRAEDSCAARVATAQDAAIARSNAEVEAATARAVESAKAEAAARLRSTRVRLEGERDAAIKARPECARDLDSFRLLNSAIDLANGATPAGNGVPDPVPAATTTDKR
jgi:hypothetical protein